MIEVMIHLIKNESDENKERARWFKMRVNQYKLFLEENLVKNKHRVVFVKGPVGIGKSEVTRQVADKLGFEIRDIRLSLLDPTDLRGLPTIRGNETLWTRPNFLPPEDYNKDLLLFFDEFNTAAKSLQNACLQLMLDRSLGEYHLPEKTRVVCAGNRVQDGAFITTLSSAWNNRVVHITLECNLDDWKVWAYKNSIDPLIIGFHNYTDGRLLHNFKVELRDEPFASPRSWKFAHEILQLKLDDDTLFECLKGAIGEGAGIELYGFLKIYRDLPNPKEILSGKDVIPKDSNVLFALCSALINCVRKEPVYLDRLIKYSLKLPREFSVILMKDLAKTELQGRLFENNYFRNEWYKVNRDVIV